MEMTGEQRIAAPRETVWAALNDPEVLKACIPGCQSLAGNQQDGLEATVVAKIGPVKATFHGKVTFSDILPPESYTISGEGKGGVAGFAKGSAQVFLKEDGADTVLSYVVKAQVGGKLAQLGSRLIDSTAKQMADQFFTCFCEKAAEPAGTGAAAPAEAPALETLAAAPGVPVPPAAAGKPSGGMGWMIGAGLAAAVALAVLYGVLA